MSRVVWIFNAGVTVMMVLHDIPVGVLLHVTSDTGFVG
jgi:hypothetical protein